MAGEGKGKGREGKGKYTAAALGLAKPRAGVRLCGRFHFI